MGLLSSIKISANINLILVVIASLGVLIPFGDKQDKLSLYILENRVMIFFGKISFSLYMWHQIVLAFTRYFILDKFGIFNSTLIFIVILLLSISSYFIVEQPFRDKKRIKTITLLWVTGIIFFISTGFSIYIYSISGILKDVPELGITRDSVKMNLNILNVRDNTHIKFNARIYDYNVDFKNDGKIQVLVIGNSFARDWANILLESKYRESIELSYIDDLNNIPNPRERLNKAKYIFFSNIDLKQLTAVKQEFDLDTKKVYNVGPKSFGLNNGIFFNRRGDRDYCSQRTRMEKGFFERNNILKRQWKKKYIDLIEMVIDKNRFMPVFTPDCKFISQDCRHLTQDGAAYFSKFLEVNKNLNFGL